MKDLINHTNHPYEKWGEEQKKAASKYGKVIDLPFPAISSNSEISEIKEAALNTCEAITKRAPAAVLCQGESVYTFWFVTYLKQAGIPVLAACSTRVAEENVKADGSIEKISEFRFVRFREY